MTVEYEKINSRSKWICPHCGKHPERKFDVLDRNTCTLEVCSEDFAKRSDFLFWELHCPNCGGISYLFELTLCSDDKGYQFVADGCWTVSNRTLHSARSDFHKWEYERLDGVDFYDGDRADWIGIHRFGPFADFNEGRRQATRRIEDIYRLAEELKAD